VVIDGVVQVGVPGATLPGVAPAGLTAQEPVAAAVGDAAELLDVDVDQVTGRGVTPRPPRVRFGSPRGCPSPGCWRGPGSGRCWGCTGSILRRRGCTWCRSPSGELLSAWHSRPFCVGAETPAPGDLAAVVTLGALVPTVLVDPLRRWVSLTSLESPDYAPRTAFAWVVIVLACALVVFVCEADPGRASIRSTAPKDAA
jgi:hypothetical protein